MSRRDTILIAVLINVGLLVILFATARTADTSDAMPIVAAEPLPVEQPPVVVERSRPAQRYVVNDEVDQVLNEYRSPEAPPVATPVIAAPTPIPAAPAASDTNFVEVTVKRGDSLDKIARANGTSVDAIVAANDLGSTVLQIGQSLRVPATRRRISQDTAQAQETASEDQFYTIRSGDNPWSISMKYRIPLDDLLALNQLDEGSARKLKPGDRIRIK